MILIFLIIIIVLAIWAISLYNKGIVLKNYVKEAFSTMDVYMKKRWDLIPNLLETVKGYMEHEKSTFEKITELRKQNYGNLSDSEKMEVNKQLGAGLANLFAVAENYPELKANENFTNLMNQLTSVEEDIANARKYYNGTVRELNTYTEVFPSNLISSMFNIQQAKLYEIDEAERQNVKVEF